MSGGSKTKKWPKMTKNSVCFASYLRDHTSYDLHLWYISVKGYLQFWGFFFLQILIFGVNIWATGEKMAQNDNKLYLSHSISQEAYIMWPWFLVCRCKIMTSPLSFFLNFDFLGCYGAKWQKTTQNGQKICLSHSISQEPYLIWSWFLVHLRKMMISPASFFIFSKFQIFWFLGGVGKKVKKWPIITNFSLSNSISQEL